MEHADLLTAAAATLDWIRSEIQAEEVEVTLHQTRLEVLREMDLRLTGKPARRRARTAKLIEMGEGRSNVPETATAEPDLVA